MAVHLGATAECALNYKSAFGRIRSAGGLREREFR
jgi:hypothetical protein